jgi:prepilin-type N-terminal cleavage/methylation domain-containing protein
MLDRRRTYARRAVTLLELVITLAIMVVLAAIAAPSIRRTWNQYRVRAAGGQLRAALTHAHVVAMRTGQIQVLRFELGGSSYFVQPWMAGDEAINASANEAFKQSTAAYQAQPVDEEKLPEDVIFHVAEAKFDTRSQEIEMEAAMQRGAGVQWSQPILFYPDGTASQATVTLANERGEAVVVKVRKLTGIATVGELTTLETLQASPEENE